jgi:uncharacterized repeat protein (TIGR03843 family)
VLSLEERLVENTPALWRPNVPRETHLLLKHGEIRGCQDLGWGSNYTFCIDLCYGDQTGRAVYKPRRGERPLWDFPDGSLYRREYGAFLVSQALGWPFIPPTVLREGPHGVGSVQLFVDSQPPRSMRELTECRDIDLARIAAFDFVTNNADRKAGHLLRAEDGKLWSIDHGLCFNAVPKVRSVLLHFCGEQIPGQVLSELHRFRLDEPLLEGLTAALRPLIADEELDAFMRRLDWMLDRQVYPALDPYRSVPWPPF